MDDFSNLTAGRGAGEFSLWRAACELSGQHWAETAPSPVTIEKAQLLCQVVIAHGLVIRRMGVRVEIPPRGTAHVTGPAVLIRMVAYRAESIEDWPRIRGFLTGYTVARADLATFQMEAVGAPAPPAQAKPQATGTSKEPLPTKPAASGHKGLSDEDSSTPMSQEETDREEKSDSNGEGQLKRKLWALADQTAERIRKADGYVSLNAVCKELRKPAIRNDHRVLLYGQKGWHGDSWLKAKGRLHGWADPLTRK